jgi:predicted TIM-barrel fold metal-dependent hydrolase
MRGGFPFTETTQPTLLLQDIDFSGFQEGTFSEELTKRVGISEIKDLNGFHDFLRRWFQKYGLYATAVKSGIAYRRGLDFEQVPAELAEGPFKKRLESTRLSPEEAKLLQDHLFWFCVGLADEHNLPVKLHLGYYAGSNYMPISRVEKIVAQAADLCIRSPKTRFMFMHTAYPYGHELIAVAKHFTNAYLQTCWAWIIDPVGTKDFLKRYLVTAPTNKINIFGGDYHHVENVVGHARMARNGVYASLAELVDEGYLERDEALELVEPILRGNGRSIFNLEKKYEAARNVPWSTKPGG